MSAVTKISSCHVGTFHVICTCMCNGSWGIGQQGSPFGSFQFRLIPMSFEFTPFFLKIILVGKCISTLTKLFCHK